MLQPGGNYRTMCQVRGNLIVATRALFRPGRRLEHPALPGAPAGPRQDEGLSERSVLTLCLSELKQFAMP